MEIPVRRLTMGVPVTLARLGRLKSLAGSSPVLAAILFSFVFVTHALSPITTSTDSRWSVPLLMSLLYRGDSDLDEYGEKLRADWHDWTIECVNGDGQAQPSPRTGCPPGSHAYSFYPLGTPVLAAPIFVVVDACVRVLGPASNRLYGNYLTPDARSFLQGEYLACFAFVER